VFVSGHRRNEVRSLIVHRVIAERLRAAPGPMLRKVEATLDRRNQDPNASCYVREWRLLLEGPLDRLIAVMVADDEHSAALRQATPFSGVLTSVETWSLNRRFREEYRDAAR